MTRERRDKEIMRERCRDGEPETEDRGDRDNERQRRQATGTVQKQHGEAELEGAVIRRVSQRRDLVFHSPNE